MNSFIPGFDFRDGELLVTTNSRIMKIRGWPQPCALEATQADCWREFRPEFRLVKPVVEPAPRSNGDASTTIILPEDNSHKKQAFEAFRSSLAPESAAAIESFQSHQWNLLDLISQHSEVLDLTQSNPVLAYLLANNDEFRRLLGRTPAIQAGVFVSRKQREILNWLGFPPTEAMARLLRKIVPEAISPHEARLLRQALNSEPAVQKLLAHQQRINAGVLSLVANVKLLNAVTPRLLSQVAGDDQEQSYPHAANLLVDAIYMLFMIRTRLAVPHFVSLESIREFHDSLEVEYTRVLEERRRKKRRARKDGQNIQPPLPGTKDIIPLTTKEQLHVRRKGGYRITASGVTFAG